MKAIQSQVQSRTEDSRVLTAVKRASLSLRQSLATFLTGIEKSSSRTIRAASPCFEPLESRELMSGSLPGPALFDSARSLGNMNAHGVHSTKGAVGGSLTDVVDSFNVTQPLTLTLQLSSLRQTDTAEILFPNGQVVIEQTSAGGSLKMKTPLNPGEYYVDVTTDELRGEMSSKVTVHHISPLVRNFVLQLRGGKLTGVAPIENNGGGGVGAIGSGSIQEPITETQEQGMLNLTYAEVPNTSLFGTTGQPSPDDVIQDQLGDCWFMSTLSEIARTDPGLIEQEIVSLGNDMYKVEFFNDVNNTPQPDWITIDGTLPQDSSGNLPFAQVPSDGAIWAPLMEKAMCYFRDQGTTPNYMTIEGGWGDEALKDLGATSILEAGTTNAGSYGYGVTAANATQLEQQMSQWLQSGDPVVADTIPDSSTGQSYTTTLVGGHQYSVVAIETNGDIELRNPWGDNPISINNLSLGNLVPSDGGYVSVTPQQFYSDVPMVFGGVMPQVTITPTPNPTPNPTPSPTPAPQTASATGTVFNDLNNDSNYDQGDPGISGVTVYATTTQGATFQTGDPSAVSDSNGNFTISGLAAGTQWWFYEIAPAGYTITDGNDGYYGTPTAGETLTDSDFGNMQNTPTGQTASATGTVFNDLNNDSSLDQGDPGISGVLVYATTTQAGAYQSGDPIAVSDSNGNFTINGLTPGVQWWFYEQAPSGYTVTDGNDGWYATPTAGETITGVQFGNYQSNPTPSPTPNPNSTTLDIQQSSQYSDISSIIGTLGANSVTLPDQTVTDAYVFTAQTSGMTVLGVATDTTGASPEIEVIDFSAGGAVVNVTSAGASAASNAFADFPITAGDQYEVLVASATDAGGTYALAFNNQDLGTPAQLTAAWFNNGDPNGIITAPNTPAPSGTLFAGLPAAFGQAPQPNSPSNSMQTINATMGPESYQTTGGALIDEYTMTAASSSFTTLSVASSIQGFAPDIYVVEYAPNGVQTNSWFQGVQSDTPGSVSVGLNVQAGYTYQVFVGSTTGVGGNYQLAYQASAFNSVQQVNVIA